MLQVLHVCFYAYADMHESHLDQCVWQERDIIDRMHLENGICAVSFPFGQQAPLWASGSLCVTSIRRQHVCPSPADIDPATGKSYCEGLQGPGGVPPNKLAETDVTSW